MYMICGPRSKIEKFTTESDKIANLPFLDRGSSCNAERGGCERDHNAAQPAGRPAVAWLVDTPASRYPAYAMVRPALIRRHYSRGDGDARKDSWDLSLFKP
jgi:hypothetical protein